MYEIWSVGHKPFEDCANNKVKLKLSNDLNMHSYVASVFWVGVAHKHNGIMCC